MIQEKPARAISEAKVVKSELMSEKKLREYWRRALNSKDENG